MFHLPSLDRLYIASRNSLKRFPLVLASGLACFGIMSVLILRTSMPPEHKDILSRVLFPCMLGIPLFFSLALFDESSEGAFPAGISNLAGVAFLAAYYFSYSGASPLIYIYRFWQFCLGIHLMVAFAPYMQRGSLNGFWQFNQILFRRFLEALFYSGALYMGLSLALAAIDHLLGIHIDSKTYAVLYFWMAYIFNTWFFLTGIPKDLPALDQYAEYPTSLKIFTQYILIPLVTLYLLILYAYMSKILMQGQWPKGTVGWLVAGVATFGVFSLLLVYPLEERSDHRWIRLYARGFYLALFPLVVLLLLAWWRRASEYGITENRYFLFNLTVWITLIAVYFTFFRARNIKIIPMSLAALAFVTSAGPLSGYAISERSQRRRLQNRLEALRVLVNGAIQKNGAQVSFEQREEISGLVDYLLRRYGTPSLQPWFKEDLHATAQKPALRHQNIFYNLDVGVETEKVMTLMGIPYVNQRARGDTKNFYYTADSQNTTYSVSGYDLLKKINGISRGAGYAQSFKANGKEYKVIVSTYGAVDILEGERSVIRIPLQTMLTSLKKHSGTQPFSNLPADDLTAEAENDRLKAKILLSNIHGVYKTDGDALADSNLQVNYIQGDLLLKFKRAKQ